MCDQCPPHPCPCTTSPSREAAMVTIKPGVWCDPCIASLVAALNAWGIETVASCCGHGEQLGRISLADGRDLFIASRTVADLVDVRVQEIRQKAASS